MVNGKKIKIWRDKRIPIPSIDRVQSPIKILDRDSRAEELTHNATRRWDEIVVEEIFSREEADVIYCIPISKMGVEDKFI